MPGKVNKLIELYRADGFLAAAQAVTRSLISSICDYQIQEVRGRVIWEQDPPPSDGARHSRLATQCVIIETAEKLQRYASEFRLPFRDSVESLKMRLEQDCVVILVRGVAKDGGGQEIVGYSIMELGGFSAAGIKGRLSHDTVFVHHTEVALEYRGQRIAETISRARNEYCRANGIKKSFTAHTTGNVSSERAFRRFGSRVLCYAVRVSFFRGLFVWQTPWRTIERAIASLGDSSGLEVLSSKARRQAEAKVRAE
jgi:hypothetical protein